MSAIVDEDDKELFSKEIEDKSQTVAVAIFIGFNEQDVICSTIDYALSQGLHVYYLDDRSDDDTRMLVKARYANNRRVGYSIIEDKYRCKKENSGCWDLALQLSAKTDLARGKFRHYQWIVHADCDEFYSCPWATTVLGGLQTVPLQYGIVECLVLDYFPSVTDQKPWQYPHCVAAHVDQYLNTYVTRLGRHSYNRFLRNSDVIDICIGHNATTTPPHVFNQKMVMHHFSCRSIDVAVRKTKKDRVVRISVSDKQKGYGTHYNETCQMMLPINISKTPVKASGLEHAGAEYRVRKDQLFRPIFSSTQHPFTVLYGCKNDQLADVTARAIDLFYENGALKIPATMQLNTLFGDPAPNVQKTLTIVDRSGDIYVLTENRVHDIVIPEVPTPSYQ